MVYIINLITFAPSFEHKPSSSPFLQEGDEDKSNKSINPKGGGERLHANRGGSLPVPPTNNDKDMETIENNELTAERSLAIITEQIEQSRKAVSKSTGQALYVAGLSMMGMSIVIAITNYMTKTPLGHLLWFLLPLIIIWAQKKNKEREHAPVSLIGTLVGKTWWTFATFTLVFFLITIIWNSVAARLYQPDAYMQLRIRVTPIIVLLMGMTVTITGHILRSRWLVVFGFIAGIGTCLWEWLGISSALFTHLVGSPSQFALVTPILHCFTYLLFAFFGLALPGYLLKRQRL